ncbi:MAG: 4'-phosphopantetheinyl transferase superfamily protein [Clostridia bacterium]|nr:4'-phosphopantetheinyl transferase superfamily protein [Clostridia bacterium]
MQVLLGVRAFPKPQKKEAASAAVRALLFEMLRSIGVDEAPAVEKEPGGRPFARFSHHRIDFSFSHTDTLIACAVAVAAEDDPAPRVGVDIELPHPRISPQRIAERFFAPAEIRLLREHDFDADTFLDLWTKKEAYLKFTGTGLAHHLKETDTTAPDRLTPPVFFASFPLTDFPEAHLTLCLPRGVEAPQFAQFYH